MYSGSYSGQKKNFSIIVQIPGAPPPVRIHRVEYLQHRSLDVLVLADLLDLICKIPTTVERPKHY